MNKDTRFELLLPIEKNSLAKCTALVDAQSVWDS